MENTQSLYDQIAQDLQTEDIVLSTIPQGQDAFGKPFPLVLQPRNGKVNFVQLQKYFVEKRTEILKCSSDYGAVLFKGFDIVSGEEWATLLYKVGFKEMLYVGIAVRRLIVGSSSGIRNVQVVTTNESPPQEPIPFHHELAQTPHPPTHISFFCQIKAAQGGSTPILRSDYVFNFIQDKYPELVPKFEDGVRYIRRVPEVDDFTSAIGRSWKSLFKVQTREEAEAKLPLEYDSWEWIQAEDGSYDLKMVSKAITAVRVSSNGRKTFFNQVVAAYTGWSVDHRNKDFKHVVFKDGTDIPPQAIADIEEFMIKNQVQYPWDQGDFVIVDNTVSYHSRETFHGRRIIYASIADGLKISDCDQLALALSSGDYIPSVGLGLKNIHKEQTEEAVLQALKSNYRYIDSAASYGNEKEVGLGIKKAISESVVQRKDIFVASKLWNTYHRKEHVKAACLKTLADLGLEYLDLYLVHYPVALQYVSFDQRYPPGWSFNDSPQIQPDVQEDNVAFSETWQAMEELVKEGLVRNIGVCNVGLQLLRDIVSYAKVKPTVVQVELHPYLSQDSLHRYCREQGIAFTALNPLGEDCLESVSSNPIIIEIAKEVNKTPAQVILRWAVQRGTAIVPSTSDGAKQVEYFGVQEFNLKQEFMEKISGLNRNQRFEKTVEENLKEFKTFLPLFD